MAEKIEMPKLSDTMEEGVIAKWNVKEGDSVNSGDVIAEVETDKATMEVEVFDSGTILKILVEEGEAVPLGGLMAVIGEKGEDISEILEGAGSGRSSSEGKEGSASKEKAEDSDTKESDKSESKKADADAAGGNGVQSGSGDDDGRIKASPLARKIAEEKGIALNRVEGSGPEGRIVKKDIEEFKGADVSYGTATFESAESEDLRVSQMRKVIAKRLSESKFSSPHFYETVDIDMKQAVAARSQLNEISDVKISFNDIVVKACAAALRQHPFVNSSWQGDSIRKHGDVHIAVAVAIDEGLMTPVIQHADKKSLRAISTETRELAGLARDRKLQPEQMEGSTFTISNLGMFGIEEFTAIINPPNACILAVGAIREVPVVEDGEIVPGKRMKVTLSSDHRVVDGAKAAQFLNTVRQMLENLLALVL
ncbi:MAG: pyruvate dehydrogenase complex dihydrolipoamide acetyltransferase [Balneolaceae bacterium]